MIWRRLKTDDKYKDDPEFRKAIDDAFPRAEPAGSRHARPAERAERVRLAKEAFSEIPSINLGQKKEEDQRTSSLTIFLVNQKGEQGVKQQGVMD